MNQEDKINNTEISKDKAPEEKISEEKMQEQYINSLQPIQEGQLIEGKIVAVTDENVFVDVGYKSEGKVKRDEFEVIPRIGDSVYVVLIRKEGKEGQVIVSKEKADERLYWKNLKDAFTEPRAVSGKITQKIKGGFQVTLTKGIQGFVPLSKIDIIRVTDADEYVGLESKFYIESLYSRGKVNIVLNRRKWLEDENSRKRKEFFEKIKIGDEVEGTVKSFTSFGAFIDLGGFDGLLHINDMSWRHVNTPKDVVALGSKMKFKVIRINPEENRINLSLKHFTEDPWSHFENKYNIDDVVTGKVTKLADFGAFVELEEGIEGLVHISEFSWVKRVRHPKEVLKVGDQVEVKILSYDIQQGKLSLGLKQVYPNPWDDIDSRFPVGMRIKRRIKNLTNFGAFLEVEDGIDGLLHVDDISWVKKINNPEEVLKVGDEIEVMVIGIDKENQRIKLGLKQLSEDPWRSLAKAFPRGSVIEGTIKEINERGCTVTVQGDIEGRVNKGNLFDPTTETLEDAVKKYKAGDSVKALVTEINPSRQRLSLSIKDYFRKLQKEEMVKYIHNDKTEEKVVLAEFLKDKLKD